MIEIKKPVSQSLALNETIVVLTGNELNVGSKTYNLPWNRELVVYATFYNSTNENFTNFSILDTNSLDLIQQVDINSGGIYSISFAGDSIGNPNSNTKVINLIGNLTISWFNFGTVTNGGITIKIYSKSI